MGTIHATSALLPDGWHSGVRITTENGLITQVEIGVDVASADEHCEVLIPGMLNVHSHAFQRGMAALAEVRGPSDDTFWTWRTQMYRFASTMTPDHVEAFASQLYVEMLEAGFTRVGEFHYLHHNRDGRPYSNPAEMASRIVSAAAQTGIGLSLLPVFYAHSNFGGAEPSQPQKRFVCSLAQFTSLLSRSRDLVKSLPGAAIGIAPHSLRAVTAEELHELIQMAGANAIHIHAAEQIKEVNDCLAWSGARPVEWLLDHAPVNDRWCLIHATHMTREETTKLASSGATVGLCPITEANLGDGVFPARHYFEAGGAFGIGSDSNIQIGVAAELRQLEYGQRLTERMRNVISRNGASTGRTLFDCAIRGGGNALKAPAGSAVGNAADLVSLSTERTPCCTEDALLDNWIFSDAVRPDGVWARGQKVVTGGRHRDREKIHAGFHAALRDVLQQ